MEKKLRNKRMYFDSADYFRAAQGIRDVPLQLDAPSCIYEFTRDAEGNLVRAETVAFSSVRMKEVVARAGGVNLHGILEYPLGTQAYPIAVVLNGDGVSGVTMSLPGLLSVCACVC